MIKKLISILFITCIFTFVPITIYADNQSVTSSEFTSTTEYTDDYNSDDSYSDSVLSAHEDYYNSSEYYNQRPGIPSMKDTLYEAFEVFAYLIFGLFFTHPIVSIIVLIFSLTSSIVICRKAVINHNKEYTISTFNNSFSYSYKVTEFNEVKINSNGH